VLQNDPEAVRAYFLDTLREEGWTLGGFIKNAIALKAGEGIEDLRWVNRMKPRAVLLLQQWKPGQTDIRSTEMPSYLKNGKAPLWDLYLIDPYAACSRGADDTGGGGK
jgi:hypothetical protein